KVAVSAGPPHCPEVAVPSHCPSTISGKVSCATAAGHTLSAIRTAVTMTPISKPSRIITILIGCPIRSLTARLDVKCTHTTEEETGTPPSDSRHSYSARRNQHDSVKATPPNGLRGASQYVGAYLPSAAGDREMLTLRRGSFWLRARVRSRGAWGSRLTRCCYVAAGK